MTSDDKLWAIIIVACCLTLLGTIVSGSDMWLTPEQISAKCEKP